jgi:hypothetical protein
MEKDYKNQDRNQLIWDQKKIWVNKTKKLVLWKSKQDWQPPVTLTKERRRPELIKSEMKKGILQQTPMEFRWSYGIF